MQKDFDSILYILYNRDEEEFNYPNYAGLEETVSHLLSLECVDAIQYRWDDRNIMKRLDWVQSVKSRYNEIA